MGGELTNPNKLDKNVLSIFSIGDNSYGNITYLNKKQLNITKLFMDNYYQCYAIDTNNTLYSWGLNNYYQLANGKNCKYLFNNDESESHKRNENNFCVISSASKSNISKAIGKIFYSQIEFPIQVPKIKKISCGDGFTMFLDTSGLLYSVGKNDKGQLGYELPNSDAEFVDGIKCNPKVTRIDYFKNEEIKIGDIICGSDFCFALEYLDMDNLNEAHRIPEEIFSWGNNEFHQLGIEDNQFKYYFKPTKATLLNRVLIQNHTKIQKFVCGWSHGCFLCINGEIFIWGNPFNEYNKKYKDIEVPININNLKNITKILDISSGFNHIAILTLNRYNTIKCYTYGANEFGQLGYETEEIYTECFGEVKIPKADINENLNINRMECGAYHTIIQMGVNLIYGFGQNNCQQIGRYKEDFLITPKKWNHSLDFFFKDDKETDQKVLTGIKCSNGITCLLFKNKSQLEKDEEKNYYEIEVNTENLPLKTS
jgi:alpha-tubulin suppressor-like RCC1 family protein